MRRGGAAPRHEPGSPAEAAQWLLVPTQASPSAPIELTAMRLTGSDSLAVRASRKLKNDELLEHEHLPIDDLLPPPP